jgi:hypothetical protein
MGWLLACSEDSFIEDGYDSNPIEPSGRSPTNSQQVSAEERPTVVAWGNSKQTCSHDRCEGARTCILR